MKIKIFICVCLSFLTGCLSSEKVYISELKNELAVLDTSKKSKGIIHVKNDVSFDHMFFSMPYIGIPEDFQKYGFDSQAISTIEGKLISTEFVHVFFLKDGHIISLSPIKHSVFIPGKGYFFLGPQNLQIKYEVFPEKYFKIALEKNS